VLRATVSMNAKLEKKHDGFSRLAPSATRLHPWPNARTALSSLPRSQPRQPKARAVSVRILQKHSAQASPRSGRR
jgi:hypothetical protein